MKYSIKISPGIWQFEFTDSHIAVAKWDQIPESTMQWIIIDTCGYLSGTSFEDITFNSSQCNKYE